MKNVLFNNQEYDVVLNKNIISKVVGDKNLTAEKLAVIEVLDNVVGNADFVGSGDYVQHAKSQSKVTRYDYFETPVNIKGKDYIVQFDVAVYPNVNNYRTHKIIEKISLSPKLGTDTAIDAAVANNATSLPTYNMLQSQANVNISQQIDYDIPISTKIQNNLDMLKQQPHIRLMTGEEFAKSDIGLVKQVGEFFNSLGNKVERRNFGEVIIDENSVQSDIAHGLGRKKAITFASVPDVIQRGKQIDYQPNWKGRGKDSYIFAAPVNIAGQKGYVSAVVIKEVDTNRLYLHEVIDQNGNVFKINKETPQAIKTGVTVRDGVTGGESVSYNPMLSQTPPNVNISQQMPLNSVDNAISNTVSQGVKQGEMPQGYKERGYSETIRTKETNLPSEVTQSFIDAPEIYKELTNKETIKRANAALNSGKNLFAQFDDMIKYKDPAAVPYANALAKMCIEQGYPDLASQIVRKLAEGLTQSGQFSQAAAIALMQSDPMTALRYMQRDIDNLNSLGKIDFGKKWKDFTLNESEITSLSNLKQGDSEGIKAAFEDVGKRIAKEYPVTAWEKVVEASRIAMLLNPRTQMKNIVSNMLLKPLTRASQMTSAVMQNAYKLMGGDITPTQAFFIPKETKKLANEVWDSVSANFDNVNKYAESIKVAGKEKQVFKESMVTNMFNNIFPNVLDNLNKTFGKDQSGIMETMRNATYWLLDVGDKPFVKKNFVDRLGSYMKAQNIKSMADVPEEAITIAYQEALRATFKDDTVLSGLLSKAKHMGNPVWDKTAEVIMPFTKTPANIAMRGIDYSPAGLINTFTKAKSGADITTIIDELAKNVTGSALIGVGVFLTANGLLTGAEPENKKQAAFLKQQGWKPYSIKIGNTYYTYDWAQPAAIPLIMGATISQSKNDGTSTAVDMVKNAVTAASDKWLELSPLQGIQDILGGYGSASEKVANTLMEFPQRLMPSVLGATARVADTTQRATYSKGNVLETQKNLAQSKIPGASKQLPIAYDTWGNSVKRDKGTGIAILNQYLNPGSLSVGKSTAIDKEINRIYEQLGDENVFPRKANYTIDKGGQSYDLNNIQYSMYQKEMGEKSLQGVEAFINSAAYQKLDDEQRSKIIYNIYGNAKESADYLVLSKMGKPFDKKEEARIKKLFPNYPQKHIAEYYTVSHIINNAEGDKDSNGKTISGSVKINAINTLVSIGYSQQEAERLYKASKG